MLFAADFTPVLSPGLAASIGGVKQPADLLKLPILDPGDVWWRDWFTAAGLPVEELAKRPGTSMGAQAYEANAAIAGHGVAIVTRALFQTELADGRLIQPFDLVGDDGHAYWLVYPEAPQRAENKGFSRLAAEGSEGSPCIAKMPRRYESEACASLRRPA